MFVDTWNEQRKSLGRALTTTDFLTVADAFTTIHQAAAIRRDAVAATDRLRDDGEIQETEVVFEPAIMELIPEYLPRLRKAEEIVHRAADPIVR